MESKFNFELGPTPIANFLLQRALLEKTVSLDPTLLQALLRLEDRRYLVSVALLLRSGANANMYVSSSRYGNLHLIAYLYLVLAGKVAPEVLETAVIWLLLFGARLNSPVTPTATESLRSWLLNREDFPAEAFLRRYNLSSESIEGILPLIPAEGMTAYSIALNRPAWRTRAYQTSDTERATRYFATLALEEIPLQLTDLPLAVEYYNLAAFSLFYARGARLNYLELNHLLLKLGALQPKYPLAATELIKMLEVASEYGMELDSEQVKLLSAVPLEERSKLVTLYSQPYWKKVCLSAPEVLPAQFRSLATYFNLPLTSTRKEICETFEELSKLSPEVLQTTILARQEERLINRVAWMREYATDGTTNLTFVNRYFPDGTDRLSFDDYHLAYYRVAEKVYLYTSESFASLVTDGFNPETRQPLPPEFLFELRGKLELLALLPTYPVTSSFKVIPALTQPDQISEEEFLARFYLLAAQYGFSREELTALGPEHYTSALRRIGYSTELLELTPRHVQLTVANVLLGDPSNAPLFFANLR